MQRMLSMCILRERNLNNHLFVLSFYVIILFISIMGHIYWKGVRRKIDKFIERIIDCIIIFFG